MILLRSMNPDGKTKFIEYIKSLNSNKFVVKPDLNSEPYSTEFSVPIYLDDNIQFKNRLEMIKYIDEMFTLNKINRGDVISNNGLWTWLAYVWFDQITMGKQKIFKMFERYICVSYNNYGLFKVHLIAPYYNYYSLYKNNEIPIWKMFFYDDITNVNQFNNWLTGNQDISSNVNVLEAIFKLYFDESKNKHIEGFSSDRPGSLRRFIKVFRQLNLNYDLHSMNSDEIIKLLPKEFEYWKQHYYLRIQKKSGK